MRPLLLPGPARRRRATTPRTGGPALALFESAHVYRPSGPLDDAAGRARPGGATPARERHHLAALLDRRPPPGGWRSEARPADFYAARALLEAVLAAAGVELARRARRAARSCTRAARRGAWPATAASSAGSASCTARGARVGARPARSRRSSSTSTRWPS